MKGFVQFKIPKHLYEYLKVGKDVEGFPSITSYLTYILGSYFANKPWAKDNEEMEE